MSVTKLINVFILGVAIVATKVNAYGIAGDLTVSEVRIDKTGLGFVTFNGPLDTHANASVPACVQGAYASALAFNVNTKAGQAILALVLAAKTSGKVVFAKGNGKCNLYGVMEDWDYGIVKK